MTDGQMAEIIALARRTRYVIVATADSQCVPHIAIAGRLGVHEGMLSISSWYCPLTLNNLQEHPQITAAIWDSRVDRGFQIVGKVERMVDLAVLDGYAPGQENIATYPQVERKLLISIDSVMHFSLGIHSDIPQ